MPALRNERHERFAQEIAKGKNGADAYLAAGYALARAAASRNAYRLRNRQDVAARIAELSAKARGRIAAERSPKVSAGVHPPCIVRNSLNSAEGLRSLVAPTRKWPTPSASIKLLSIGGRRGTRNSASPSSTAKSRRMPRLRKASTIVPSGTRTKR